MPDLNRVTPLVPKRYPKEISDQQFHREVQVRFEKLEQGLNDLKKLIFQYMDQI